MIGCVDNQPKPAIIQTAGDEVVIFYGYFEQHPVEIVINQIHEGRVTLRLVGTWESMGDQADAARTDFLKAEVARLKTGQVVELGNGYAFQFEGGYPIWGPHQMLAKDLRYDCLTFAEGGLLTDKLIRARGTPEKGAYYPEGYLDG